MNAVFWILVVLALYLFWFLCSFSFKGIGRFFMRLYDNAKSEMTDEESKEHESED